MAILLVLGVVLAGVGGAANYMYEKANVKGVGYKNVETIIQTQAGLAGNKLVEKESGSGNVITERTEIEAQRDPDLSNDHGDYADKVEVYNKYWVKYDSSGHIIAVSDTFPGCGGGWVKQGGEGTQYIPVWDPNAPNSTGCCPDYINFTKEAEFEYMPVSYQTGTYDQKWIEKLCVQNYNIGAVVVEMYTHAQHLQKNTEVKTRRDCEYRGACGYCTGALEANFNSNVIGVAHIGWLSKDTTTIKGRHPEWGRSVEDLTGVFSIEKFIQLWGNDTCGDVQVDWLPCI